MIQYKSIHTIIRFANSDLVLNFNDDRLRLRVGYFNDLRRIIGSNGQISRSLISNEAIQYCSRMFEEWLNSSGEIDSFIKGYISYEVGCAISMIFPTINDIDILKELILHFKLDLEVKNMDTIAILSQIMDCD